MTGLLNTKSLEIRHFYCVCVIVLLVDYPVKALEFSWGTLYQFYFFSATDRSVFGRGLKLPCLRNRRKKVALNLYIVSRVFVLYVHTFFEVRMYHLYNICRLYLPGHIDIYCSRLICAWPPMDRFARSEG